MEITIKQFDKQTVGIFENIDLLKTLRTKFRLFPKPVGTLPHSIQNKLLGPPFLLTSFQLRYLSELGQIPGSFDCDEEKYQVFKHFTSQNLTLREGCKFGVDFLGYPGDPLYCHGSKMIKIGSNLPALQLVTLCRISNDTCKDLIIAFKSVSGEIKCKHISWTTTGAR